MTNGPLRRLLGLARRAADPTDDAGLLARFAAGGDADAFELLVWRHGALVLGVARRILGDGHAAEDVFQATFLALARQAKSVRRDGCVAGWLHRVARRTAVRARRKPFCVRFARNVNSESLDPVIAASRRELSQLVDEEIDRLPERFRRPVVLCYLEGRSTADAAELLGCPRGTVLSRLAMARDKLRRRLTRRGVTPAIVPAIQIPPVMDGGLTTAAVRAATANTAAAPVIELCDGVIRAMILSKLKFAAAVAMTLGLIGGGAGWMARTPGGAGVALADGPPAKAEPPKSAPTKEEQRHAELAERQRAQTSLLRVKLQELQDQLSRFEKIWTRDRIDARLRLAEAEEKYKRLERDLADDKTAERTGMLDFESKIAEAQRQRGRAGNDETEKRLAARANDLGTEAHRYHERHQKSQAEFAVAILEARRDMVTAEEQLSLLDRQVALKRRTHQSAVEELQDSLYRSQGAGGDANPTDRKVKDLEHKLDDVLRELADLRRDLKK
jgi:RNA polymerase sigma factor (sigma-70 family)